jgi:hypothetical protein
MRERAFVLFGAGLTALVGCVDAPTVAVQSDDVNGVNANAAINGIFGFGTFGVDADGDGVADRTVTAMQAFGSAELDADALCEGAGFDRFYEGAADLTLPFIVVFDIVPGGDGDTPSIDFAGASGTSITGDGNGTRVTVGFIKRENGVIVADAVASGASTINLTEIGDTLTADSADVMIVDFSEIDRDRLNGQIIPIDADISVSFKGARFCQTLSDVLNTDVNSAFFTL